MTPEQFELYYILRNQQIPFRERYCAVEDIAKEVRYKKIEATDIPHFYHSMVKFWRSLGLSNIDRNDERLFDIRKNIASICLMLSLQLPEGQIFFKYFPRINRAEGFEDRYLKKIMVGAIKPGYGTSLYEFHLEYPIEGAGIRKNLICVITKENERIPMLEWCRQNDIIVFCNRCGLDITYEVSRDCPFAKRRYDKRS